MKTEVITIQSINKEVTFYIGQNKHEHFDIIDAASPDDLWFHIKDTSSCHVVAIMPTDLTNKEKKYIIKAGAVLCKKYTNKCKGMIDVEIIYTEIKNLEKTKYIGCVKITNEKMITI
jgi:predicted ribosome quality control (RQC) complex YloA/Tae2 family protein